MLRSDMTVPIARVVATRYATAEPPLRFCYVAHVYRAVRPTAGRSREFLQAGIELVGAAGAGRDGGGAAGHVPRAGRRRAAGATGSGSATRRCTRSCSSRPGVRRRRARALLRELVTRDFVGLEREVGVLGLDDDDADLLVRVAAAARRARRARRRSATRRRRAATACAAVRAASQPDVADARDLRPRPRRAASATTRARSSRCSTRRWARRSAAAGATTTCSAASAARCPPSASRCGVDRVHQALTRGRGRPMAEP